MVRISELEMWTLSKSQLPLNLLHIKIWNLQLELSLVRLRGRGVSSGYGSFGNGFSDANEVKKKTIVSLFGQHYFCTLSLLVSFKRKGKKQSTLPKAGSRISKEHSLPGHSSVWSDCPVRPHGPFLMPQGTTQCEVKQGPEAGSHGARHRAPAPRPSLLLPSDAVFGSRIRNPWADTPADHRHGRARLRLPVHS